MKKISAVRLLIGFTLAPILLLLILHSTIQKSRNTNINFKRKYILPVAQIINETANPGIAEIKTYNNEYYACDYKKIYHFDPNLFHMTTIFSSSTKPIISWYYLGKKLVVTINNEKQIISVDRTIVDTIFKSPLPISKNIAINEWTIIYSGYDKPFWNEEFYLHSFKDNGGKYE